VDAQQLGWGIVGPGRIAGAQIAPAIAAAPNSTLISVVGRDLGRATEFAKAHGAAQAPGQLPGHAG
jgi:predicted dehydrogenase